MNENKKVTSMLFKFSNSFLAIGVVLVIAFTLLVGWDLKNIGLVTGLGFMLSSLFLYAISIVLNAVFSFESNLEAVKNKMNDNKVRPLWK